MTPVSGPQPDQVPEDRDRLVPFPLGFQGVCQIMGRLGSDGARGRVVADRVLSSAQPHQAERQIRGEPDVAGIAVMSRSQHIFSRLGITFDEQGRPK